MQLIMFHVLIIVLAIVAVIGFEVLVNFCILDVIKRKLEDRSSSRHSSSTMSSVTTLPRWSQGCYLSGHTKPANDFRHLIEH